MKVKVKKMLKSEQKALQNIKELRRFILKDYEPCKELNMDCPNCKFGLLLAYIEWYEDLIKW